MEKPLLGVVGEEKRALFGRSDTVFRCFPIFPSYLLPGSVQRRGSKIILKSELSNCKQTPLH